jgi:hypothetical protein
MIRYHLTLRGLILLTGLLVSPLHNGSALAAAHHHGHHAQESGAPVILSRQPGSAQDHAARRLNTEDMRGAARRGETPLVLVGSARLSLENRDPALFVQLQSASLCGSAGCSTSVYLRHSRTWRKVLDSVSGPIRVMKESHAGMHDLLVGKNDRWVWDGHVYQDTLAAPPLDDLRRSVEQHRAAMRRRAAHQAAHPATQ